MMLRIISCYCKYFLFGLFLSTIAVSTSHGSCIFSKPIEVTELDIGNMISWSTIEEIDNQYFVVEKSTNGIDYQMLGQLKAAGNSSDEEHYRYLDVAIGESRVFYRIRYVDFKGSALQTHTILVNRAAQNNFLITAMSRTITDRYFNFKMRSTVEAFAKYQLIDRKFNVVQTGNFNMQQGENSLSLDLAKMQNGRYHLVIEMDGEKEAIYIRKERTHSVPVINYVVKN